ncbi:FecR family protein [Gaoshiqia sp. Z1-71]|uniref:FecR family protein n=1 Tax=Gaoshiqia hydrogeniformans TaxID=3290090 RepID=UPI003BF8A711
MENEEELFGKISDYYSGEENGKIVKQELEQNSETRELFHWIDLFWNRLKPNVWNSGNIQKRTHEKIKLGQLSEPPFLMRAVKYAAAVLLALSVSGIAYYYIRENAQLIEVVSGTGEVKLVELPDGSKVWLNTQSSLRYPKKFKGRLREVIMNGEIYFNVKHDQEHPFIVHSDHVQVRVLGTGFLVSDHSNEPVVGTYLSHGSIELDFKELKKSMRLVPGDEVSYDKNTSNINKVNKPDSTLDSWRFGKLSFYNESLLEVARKLERKFGKEILIPDENVGGMKFTADFESETLEQILEFFSVGAQLEYQTTEKGYVITKNKKPM